MSQNSVKVREITIGEGKPKICVSIIGSTTEEVLKQARKIVKLNKVYIKTPKSREKTLETKTANNLEFKIIDIVEWRVDFFDDVFKTDIVLDTLKKLRDVLAETPILVTFRTLKEGGNRRISSNDYIQLNVELARSELADMIDVEAFSFADEDKNEEPFAVSHVAQELIDICTNLNQKQDDNSSKEGRIKIICSYHDFQRTPSKWEITGRLIAMQKSGAHVLKMAVMPSCKEDVMALLGATVEMSQNYEQKPIVTMSMGKLGSISRVMGQFTGSAITFGTIGTVSAPGQIEASKLNNLLEQLAEIYL